MVNGGTRYQAHVLQSVRTASGEILYETTPTVLDQMDLRPTTVQTLLDASRMVVTESSALRNHFKNVSVAVAGKTGTAQVTKTASDNAVFAGFAPYDDPAVVVINVLEHGSSGSNAAHAVGAILEAYFEDAGDAEDANVGTF
jgi:penicillin-binding protein 2